MVPRDRHDLKKHRDGALVTDPPMRSVSRVSTRVGRGLGDCTGSDIAAQRRTAILPGGIVVKRVAEASLLGGWEDQACAGRGGGQPAVLITHLAVGEGGSSSGLGDPPDRSQLAISLPDGTEVADLD